MKILRFYHVHPYYANLKHLIDSNKNSSFGELISLLNKKGLIFPRLFTSSMTILGHESQDFVINSSELIQKWCEEHGYLFADQFSNLCNAIAYYKPDVLFLERDTYAIPIEYKKEFKKKFPFLKCIAARWGAQTPEHHLPKFAGIDVMFAIDNTLQKLLQKEIKTVYALRPGFDPTLEGQVPFDQKKYPFTFVGTSGHGMEDHYERYNMLVKMLSQTPILCFCNEPLALDKKIFHMEPFQRYLWTKTPKQQSLARNLFRIIYGKQIGSQFNKLIRDLDSPGITNQNLYLFQMPLKYLFKRKIMPPIYGDDYLETLMHSKISLNIHIDDRAYSGNFRTFEATGAGSCLLTDRASLMKDEFISDEEIVSYNSFEEAKDKYLYLSKNPNKCAEIALKGQKRTLRDHTTLNRCEFIASKLQDYLVSK